MTSRPCRSIASVADLAREAGVSASTVSRALAGNPMISATTRKLVADLAQAHGFQPNRLASNLRLKRTQAIGVVLPLGHETGQHLSDPFFITMLGHLADALTTRGYDLLLTRVIPTDAMWLDRLVDSGRIDGLIVIGQSDQTQVLDKVAARFAPIVVWGARLPGQVHTSVGSDNVLGGRLATEHLVATGRRRLAFFGNPEVPEIAQRYQGFADVCGELGLQRSMLGVHLTPDAAYDMIAAHLDGHTAPDGIVAASDTVAMMAIRALAERRLRVPEDVGIVGYDDVTLAAHTTPPLTTVRQDLARGATLLTELLFRKLGGEAVESIVLIPELAVRGSA